MLYLSIDIDAILNEHQQLADKLKPALIEGVGHLAVMAHAHTTDQVREKLKDSTKQYIFLENFKFEDKESDDGVWYLKILHKAVWIDEGIPNGFNMLPGFLASPKAKEGPNGKYLVIPFKHNKAPSRQDARQKVLVGAIKAEMKKRGIGFGGIEKNPDGSPKMGLLHKFDINNPQQKHQVGPPNIGPQGAPWQAHSRTQGQEGPGGRPYLWNVRVYQKEVSNEHGEKSVQRDVMTFRTASEKHDGLKWIHPGSDGMNFLDEAKEWAEREWEHNVLPGILKDFGIDNV